MHLWKEAVFMREAFCLSLEVAAFVRKTKLAAVGNGCSCAVANVYALWELIKPFL